MREKKIKEAEIKRKIKELISASGEKKTKLSVRIGYSSNFLNSILGDETKFFNITHIYRICTALDYPVAKLFEGDVSSQEPPAPSQVVQPQADPLERALILMFRELSPKGKGDVLGKIEELKMQEVLLEKRRRKEAA